MANLGHLSHLRKGFLYIEGRSREAINMGTMRIASHKTLVEHIFLANLYFILSTYNMAGRGVLAVDPLLIACKENQLERYLSY